MIATHAQPDTLVESKPATRDGRTPRVTIATDVPGARRLRDRWMSMRTRAGVTSPNTDPDWFLAVVEHMGPGVTPYIALIEDAAGDTALIVARASTRRHAGRLGYRAWSIPVPLRTLDVVYEGIITNDSPRAASLACDHLHELLRARRFDLIECNHLPDASPVARALNAPRLRPTRSDPHILLDVRDDLGRSPIEQLTPKRSRQIRRERRLLEEHLGSPLRLVTMRDPGDVDRALAWAHDVEGTSYKSGIGAVRHRDPLTHTLARLDAQRGIWRAWFLTANDRPVAFVIATIRDTNCVLSSLGYRPELARFSPGKTALASMLEDLARTDARTVDYGFGEATYKRVFGSRSWNETTLALFAPTCRARLVLALHDLGAQIGTIVARLAHTISDDSTIKKIWRARLRARTARRA